MARRLSLNPAVISTLVAILGAWLYYYHPDSTLLAPLVSREAWRNSPRTMYPSSEAPKPIEITHPPQAITPEPGENRPSHPEPTDVVEIEPSPAQKRLRSLPPPQDGDEGIPSLSDGASGQLEKLGPIVVNQDGTLSRISNWEQMTEREKATTLKRLSKRNQERLARVKEELAANRQASDGTGKGL